jgi:hypothetical protein
VPRNSGESLLLLAKATRKDLRLGSVFCVNLLLNPLGKSLIWAGQKFVFEVITMILRRRFQPRAHLAMIALLSFMFAFAAARVFTTFFPSAVLIGNGIHIHHFWFGIALLAVGGWLGISYNDKDIDRLAAIL